MEGKSYESDSDDSIFRSPLCKKSRVSDLTLANFSRSNVVDNLLASSAPTSSQSWCSNADNRLANTEEGKAVLEFISSWQNSLGAHSLPCGPAYTTTPSHDVASSEYLGMVLKNLHGSEIQSNADSIIAILHFAAYSNMKGLKKQCVDALINSLDGNSCCLIFSAAHKAGSSKLKKAALNHIISNFEAACNTEAFNSLTAPLVIEILKNISPTDRPTARLAIQNWTSYSPSRKVMEGMLKRCIQSLPTNDEKNAFTHRIADIGSTYNANNLYAAVSSVSVFYNTAEPTPESTSTIVSQPRSQMNDFKLFRMKKLNGHSGHVMSLTVYLSYLISGGTEGIKVWDTSSWQCKQNLEGHHGAVLSLAVSGDKLYSGSRDCTIKIWDLKHWECLGTLIKHADAVHSILINGNCLLSGSSDGTIVIWDTTSWMVIRTLEGHVGGVKALAGIENILLSGSFDHTIRVWGLEEGKCLRSLSGHESGITSLVVLSENTKFASGSNDDTVKIWQMYTWSCIVTLRGHSDTVWAIVEIKGKLLSGSADRTIKVWNIESWQCEDTLDAHERSVSKFAIFKKFLVSSSWDHSIMLWNTQLCVQKGIHDSFSS